MSQVNEFTAEAPRRGRGQGRLAVAATVALLLAGPASAAAQQGDDGAEGELASQAARAAATGTVATDGSGTEVDAAQQQEAETIRVATGHSTVLRVSASLRRVFIGDPEVADAVPVSATEIVLNGKQIGTTTFLIWGQDGSIRRFKVDVTPDAEGLQRDLKRYFPSSDIQVSSTGQTLVLSGTVQNEEIASKAVELAQTVSDGETVIDNMAIPGKEQILLKVRFAEVSRSAMQEVGFDFLHVNDQGVGDASLGTGAFSGQFPGEGPTKTLSDAVNFFLFHDGVDLASFIQALRSHGLFKSLAEPNLMAAPGDTAEFLAGGEFPYPVVQGGAQGGAVTIEFREFGVQLNFVPTLTNAGTIRLQVAPEVSQLDFGNGLTLQGFQIPALLSRRASTVVELNDGQTFAIAGLMDNQLTENVNKVPVLGDIPILGQLFRSEEMRQNRTELLVLVTPQLVRPTREQPELPTGEPETWNWKKGMEMKGELQLDPVPTDPNSGSASGDGTDGGDGDLSGS